jgi:hypothetical protein
MMPQLFASRRPAGKRRSTESCGGGGGLILSLDVEQNRAGKTMRRTTRPRPRWRPEKKPAPATRRGTHGD